MLVFSLFLSVFWCVFSFRVGGGGVIITLKKIIKQKHYIQIGHKL